MRILRYETVTWSGVGVSEGEHMELVVELRPDVRAQAVALRREGALTLRETRTTLRAVRSHKRALVEVVTALVEVQRGRQEA
jgi:hypothetical protein